jgi:hypothetical protein
VNGAFYDTDVSENLADVRVEWESNQEPAGDKATASPLHHEGEKANYALISLTILSICTWFFSITFFKTYQRFL